MELIEEDNRFQKNRSSAQKVAPTSAAGNLEISIRIHGSQTSLPANFSRELRKLTNDADAVVDAGEICRGNINRTEGGMITSFVRLKGKKKLK